MVQNSGSLNHINNEYFNIDYYYFEYGEALKHIMEGDLTVLPSNSPLLFNNHVYKFWETFEIKNKIFYRFISGKEISKEEYCHRAGIDFNTAPTPLYGSFDESSEITESEIDSVCNSNFVYNYLSRIVNKNELKNFINKSIFASEYGCWCTFGELFQLRKISFVFAAIKNTSDSPIKLDTIVCKNGQGLISWDKAKTLPEITIDLPQILLKPGNDIIIPMFILIEPSKCKLIEHSEISNDWQNDGIYTFSKLKFESNENEYLIIGNSQIPVSMCGYSENNIFKHYFRHILPNKQFILNKELCMGSCPHIFFLSDNIEYYGEIFTNQSGVTETVDIVCPNDGKIIIAEIEFETTIISEIKINGIPKYQDILLNRNENFEIGVCKNDIIQITGKYETLTKTNESLNWSEKQELINRFITNFKKNIFSE